MNTWFKRFLIVMLLLVSPYAFAQFGVSVLTNNSGVALARGSVIVVDSSADKSFTTTTSERATNTIGVVFKSTGISNGQTGLILLQGSYAEVVLTTGVITRGDFLITSTTAGRAKSGGTSNTGAIFGFALTESGGGESSVSATLVSNATAAGLLLEDDEFLIYGTDTDYKIGFVSATPALSWLDGDDNTLMTLTDAGTVGDLAVSGITSTGDLTITPVGNDVILTGRLEITRVTGPRLLWTESTATADNQKWQMQPLGDVFRMRILPDDESAAANVFLVERTGQTVDLFEIYGTEVVVKGDLTVEGGEFAVGSAGAGNIGTTDNYNQIQFLTTTTGALEGAWDIGDGTNDLLIAADGFTTLAGTARAVLEMQHNALDLIGPGPGSPPAGPNLTGHTFTLDFSPTADEEVFITMEIPHNWAVGTDIKANFHWAPIDNGAGTVTWGVETKIITPESGTLDEASTATQIVKDDTQTTQDEFLESDLITIDMSGASVGDFLALRIFRDADASEVDADDDYGSDAQLASFHMEFIVDSFGTDEAW